MGGRLFAVVVISLALLACTNGGATTNSPSPSPSQSPTAASSAALIVTADGTVECRRYPHGCLASFIIEPGAWTAPAGWEPTEDTASFGAQIDPWELDGQPLTGGPLGIAPGDYTFALAVSEINDIVDDPDRYLDSRVLCTEAVTVPSGTATVTVHANFDEPCSIDVTIQP